MIEFFVAVMESNTSPILPRNSTSKGENKNSINLNDSANIVDLSNAREKWLKYISR